MNNTTTPPDPTRPAGVDYATPRRPPPQPVPYNSEKRPRRSLQGLAALLLVLGALPAGLGVNLVMYTRRVREDADRMGFVVTLLTAVLGTVLGWHARYRIQRRGGELYGMTSSTIATFIGLCTIAACGVVMLKWIARTQ